MLSFLCFSFSEIHADVNVRAYFTNNVMYLSINTVFSSWVFTLVSVKGGRLMKSILLDIWRSFRAMPLWVQLWVAVVLVPVNMATAVLILAHGCLLVPVLAIGGMIPNAVLMFVERGFSKAMALSHVVLWIPLLVILAMEIKANSVFSNYLMVLFIVDAISICFDLKDSRDWHKGDRKIAS